MQDEGEEDESAHRLFIETNFLLLNPNQKGIFAVFIQEQDKLKERQRRTQLQREVR